MGIYDAMMLCRADVQTYCFGLAASMGAFLLGAGKKGKRYSMPNSRIMIHQPLGGASGQAVDIEIQVRVHGCTPASPPAVSQMHMCMHCLAKGLVAACCAQANPVGNRRMGWCAICGLCMATGGGNMRTAASWVLVP